MAGRGTDIKLGPGVVELGGLAVIGTERHESRRIDNQLRGRSGRQGDPGYTKFYLSAEDDLMRRFGSDRFKTLLGVMVNQKDGTEQALESKMFSRFVESAQKKIEGNNYDSRKTVLEYDEVLRKQREIIYGQRHQILFLDDITEIILPMMKNACTRLVLNRATSERRNDTLDYKGLIEDIDGKFFPLNYIALSEVENKTVGETIDFLMNKCTQLLAEKKANFGEDIYREFLKVVLLRVVDTYWMEHIDAMSELRQAVRLQVYAQINPLREYQEVGFSKFEIMIQNIENDAMRYINRAQIRENLQREQVVKNTIASDGKEESIKRKPIKVAEKVGRNDPCPCGSGKKYKNCHGRV
jgi:preprotein translocase subunit SecA